MEIEVEQVSAEYASQLDTRITCDRCGHKFELQEMKPTKGTCPHCQQIVPVSKYCFFVPDQKFWTVYSNVPLWAQILTIVVGAIGAFIFTFLMVSFTVVITFAARKGVLCHLDKPGLIVYGVIIGMCIVLWLLYVLLKFLLRGVLFIGRNDKAGLLAYKIAKSSGGDLSAIPFRNSCDNRFAISVFVAIISIMSLIAGVISLATTQVQIRHTHRRMMQARQAMKQRQEAQVELNSSDDGAAKEDDHLVKGENVRNDARITRHEVEAPVVETSEPGKNDVALKNLEKENKKLKAELKEETRKRTEAERKLSAAQKESERKIKALQEELASKKAEEQRALEEEKRKLLEAENRKRQLEIDRETALRKTEMEKEAQRKHEAEAERKRAEELRLAAEKKAAEEVRKAAEESTRKFAEDRKVAADTLKRLVTAVNEQSVERSEKLSLEAKSQEQFLSQEDKRLLDGALLVSEVLKKADAGDKDAQARLAELLYAGNVALAKNRMAAYKWFLKLADSGDSLAQCKVGKMLSSGDGVEKNVDEAFKYMMKSAEQNNSCAQFAVAEMYRVGKGVVENQKEANKWYEKAAEAGNADAQMAWAKRLKNGEGMFFSDKDKAFEWLCAAAKSGNGEAYYHIGLQYYSGKERLKFSISKAYKMFIKAKECGYRSNDLDKKIRICEKLAVDDIKQ